MDIYEAIRTRRSIRAYSDKEIPAEVLRRVLDAARLAPSGNNRQPTRLIVIKDKTRRAELVPICNRQTFIGDAPVVIVAVGKNSAQHRADYIANMDSLINVSICVDHLTLAARAEGLGTCWIGAFDGNKLKEYLQLPADWNVICLTPLGYPKVPGFGEPRSRIALEEFAFDETWKPGAK
jgi:nitroreductase